MHCTKVALICCTQTVGMTMAEHSPFIGFCVLMTLIAIPTNYQYIYMYRNGFRTSNDLPMHQAGGGSSCWYVLSDLRMLSP